MLTPYFVIGSLFILTGVYCIFGKYYMNRDTYKFEKYDSKKHGKLYRFIGGILMILIGLFLILKGLFDPW